MLYAGIIGVIMGAGRADVTTAILVAIALLVYQAIMDVVIQRSLITGIESDYVRYIANLRAAGNESRRPWVSYILYSAALTPLVTLVAYFVARWLVGH